MARNRELPEGFEGASLTELLEEGWSFSVSDSQISIENTVVRKDVNGFGGFHSLKIAPINVGGSQWAKTPTISASASKFFKAGAYISTTGSECAQINWIAPSGTSLGKVTFDSVSGYVKIYIGTTLAATSSISGWITGSRWYRISIAITIGNTGNVDVFVDGDGLTNKAVSFSGDTQPGDDTTVNQFQLQTNGWDQITYWDDVVIDGSELPGEGYIIPLPANGNGFYSQLTGSDGNSVDNYQNIDEIPFSDTDWNEGTVVGQEDTYSLTNLPSSANQVKSLTWRARMMKSGSSIQNAQPVLRINSGDYAGSDIVIPSSFGFIQAIYDQSPATGSDFTIDEVNGLEAGVKMVA